MRSPGATLHHIATLLRPRHCTSAWPRPVPVRQTCSLLQSARSHPHHCPSPARSHPHHCPSPARSHPHHYPLPAGLRLLSSAVPLPPSSAVPLPPSSPGTDDVTPPTADVTPLARQLSARVRATGAMTVAEYMNEVLVHPLQGYYTRQSQVGQHGDFITAPEVAGMYGEMLGVWLIYEWQKLGAPQPLQLVELGPGRGTLMADILRVINRLAGDAQISIRLVEVSSTLAETQAQTLGVRLTSPAASQSDGGDRVTSPAASQSDGGDRVTSPAASQSDGVAQPGPAVGSQSRSDEQLAASSSQSEGSEPGTCAFVSQSESGLEQRSASASQWELSGTTGCGRSVTWHDRLGDVPEEFSLIVANEFFDTMPVHQFRRTKEGWREVLVDLCDEETAQFRFVLARGRTPACIFIDEEAAAGRDELEVSPRAAVLAAELAERVATTGGAALVCDYGHSGDRGDTLRAFRKHKCVDPLLAPGGADITCDVDFSQLARAVGENVLCFGPVTQRQFLTEMGLATRLERLVASGGPDQADQLRAAYDMLTGDMGERFKMWALLPSTARPILDRLPPAGFTPSEAVAGQGS